MYHRQQHGEFNYETPFIFCVLRVLFIEKFIFDERSSKFKVKTRGNRMQQSGASQRGAVGSLQKQQQRQQSNVFGIPGTLCVNRSEQCLRQ
jgi:hypothetical protein